MTDPNHAAQAFEQLDFSDHEPKWSSYLLEQLIQRLVSEADGSMRNLFPGLDLAFRRNQVELTETVANLVKDVVVTAFTQHRGAYAEAEWGWANDRLAEGAEPAECYLFLHAVPPDQLTVASLVAVLEGLKGTSRFDEAVSTLSEDLERPDMKTAARVSLTDLLRGVTEENCHAEVDTGGSVGEES